VPSASSLTWTVLSRADCSLCEQLLLDFAELLDPAQAARVQVLDVSSDPELERKYGTRVPVLLADGEFVCAYRLDQERVRALLGTG
jgi:peroxiredoxin